MGILTKLFRKWAPSQPLKPVHSDFVNLYSGYERWSIGPEPDKSVLITLMERINSDKKLISLAATSERRVVLGLPRGLCTNLEIDKDGLYIHSFNAQYDDYFDEKTREVVSLVKERYPEKGNAFDGFPFYINPEWFNQLSLKHGILDYIRFAPYNEWHLRNLS